MSNFVISLVENNNVRRNHISHEFLKAGLSFSFFDAITPSQNSEILSQYNLDKIDTDLTNGAMACFLSHYLIWQKVIEESLPYATIFEDDIYLGDNASFFLKDYDWINIDFHILKLEKGVQDTINTSLIKMAEVKKRKIFKLKSAHYGMGGYIVSNTGAQFLVNQYEKLDSFETVDKVIFQNFIKKPAYIACQMLPAICVQDCILNEGENNFPSSLPPPEYNTSNILSEKKEVALRRKIIREMLRPFSQLKRKTIRVLFTKKVQFK